MRCAMPSTSNSSATPTSDRPPMTFQNRSTRRHPLTRIAAAGALALAALGSLQGCVLLLGAGAVGGGLVFTDRRTSGTQLDDQSIELKSGPRVHEVLGDTGHVNVTSYNRVVLITGEVATPEDKAKVEKAVSEIQNVNTV